MKEKNSKIGLVLSGGGAKGAYEAGVIKAMHRFRIEPEVIAGASIGAINGAVIACSDNFEDAVKDLEMVWTGIDSDDVIKTKMSAPRAMTLMAFHQCLNGALSLNPKSTISQVMTSLVKSDVFTEDDKKLFSVLDRSPLEKILEKAVNFNKFSNHKALDFYVAAFPNDKKSPSLLKAILKYAVNQSESDFFKVNDFPHSMATKLILASAALPFAFEPVKINGRWYFDGGMGGRVEAQGNTPVRPIADAGCTHAVVVMLDNGVLWDRAEWPDLTAITIRPSIDMGGFSSLLDFSPARIRELIAYGEQDALKVIGKFWSAQKTVLEQKRAEGKMKTINDRFAKNDDGYENTMKTLDDRLKLKG